MTSCYREGDKVVVNKDEVWKAKVYMNELWVEEIEKLYDKELTLKEKPCRDGNVNPRYWGVEEMEGFLIDVCFLNRV